MRLTTLLGPELEETLRKDPFFAKEIADELNAPDLAELICALPDDLAVGALATLTLESAAAVLDELEDNRRVDLVQQLDPERAAQLAEVMSADERADVFQELPEDVRSDLLSRMDEEEREDVRELIRHEEASAGGLMTTDFVSLDPNVTVESAIEQVRATAADMETIYEAYAVDPHGTLLGSVSLQALVLAGKGSKIADVMDADVRSVPPEMDQEELSGIVQKYGLLAVPVVDNTTRKLLGIVTVDDVVDVLKEEQAEDIEKLGAVQPVETPYFDTSFWTLLRSRAVWLVAIFLVQLLTFDVIESFHWAAVAAPALSALVPLIVSSGGNTGNQSASLVVRGLALGELKKGDGWRLLSREGLMGLVLGGSWGLSAPSVLTLRRAPLLCFLLQLPSPWFRWFASGP